MEIENAKYKINEKVKYLYLTGVVIDVKFQRGLGMLYLVKYKYGMELWAFEDSLSKGDE